MHTGVLRQQFRATKRVATQGVWPVLSLGGSHGMTHPANRLWRRCRDAPSWALVGVPEASLKHYMNPGLTNYSELLE